MASRAYEMAFKLNAKLGNTYNSTFAKAENVAKKTFSNIAKIGAAVLGGIGIADIANTYKEFQQSMANTGAIAGVDKTSSEFRALEQAALEAGRTTTKTAKEAADALGYMKLAGWSTTDSINSLMPVLRLSEATGADLATTSDLVTDSMSAMGIATSDLSKYLDVAANANNKTNQTATQMLETFIGAGGMFKELGTSMEEAAALSGALANRGIKGSEGATSLNSILINLMGNSKSSAEALERLGVSAYDSQGKFRGITTVLEDIAAAMKTASDEDRGWFLSKLGGKTQIDTLNALLGGITTLNEEGKNEIRELTEEFMNSSGALETMSEQMNDTFSGALAILGSASDDVKIQIMKELEPTVTPIIRKIADALPGIGAKVAGFVKSMVRKGKELWNDLKPVFDWIVQNFDKIKIGIMGIGGTFVAAKVVGKLKNAADAVKGFMKGVSGAVNGLSSGINANALIVLTEVIVGIGVAVREAYNQAKEANLAEHFGDITLSAEEMDIAVDKLVGGKKFEKLAEQMKRFDALEPISKKIEESLEVIEKTDWKLKMGLSLTLDEQEKYKQSVDAYIADVREYFEASFQADWNLFEGNTEVQEAIKKLYLGKSDELNALGVQIKEKIEEGFKDNVLKLDEEKEIANLIAQAQKIKEGLAKADYEIEMGALGIEAEEAAAANGGRLTKEMYDEFLEKAAEKGEESKALERESYARSEYLLAETYGRDSKEYKEEMEKVVRKYYDDITGIDRSLLDFGVNTINKVYGKDLEGPKSVREELVKGVANEWTSEDGTVVERAFTRADSGVYGNFGLDGVTAGNLNDLTNKLIPRYSEVSRGYNAMMEEAKAYLKEGKGVPIDLKENIRKTEETLVKMQELQRFAGGYGTMSDLLYEDIGRQTPKSKENEEKIRSDNPPLDKFVYGADNKWDKLTAGYEDTNYSKEEERFRNEVSEKRKQGITIETVTPLNPYAVAVSKIPNIINKALADAAGKPIETDVKADVNAKAGNINTKDFSKGVQNATGKPIKTNVKADANAKAGNIDTTDFSKGVHDAASKPIKTDVKADANVKVGSVVTSGFVNSLRSTVNSMLAGLKVNVRVGTDGKIGKYAKGTEYTPDTFIAGENGAELITGAKGRKVFTALQTSNIFSNIGKIKDTLVSSVNAINVFDKLKEYDVSEILGENEGMSSEKIVRPSNTTNNNSNVTITINNEIKIDGADNKNADDLKGLIDKAMEEGGEKIADIVINIIQDKIERKARIAN